MHGHHLRWPAFYTPTLPTGNPEGPDFFFARPDFNEYYQQSYRDNLVGPVVAPSPLTAGMVLGRWAGQWSLFIRKLNEQSLARYYSYRITTAGQITEFPDISDTASRAAYAADYGETFTRQIVPVYRELNAICRLNGTRLVVAYQPILLLRERAELTEMEQRMWDRSNSVPFISRPHWLVQYAVHAPLLAAACRADDIPYLNLHEELRGCTEQVFADYCHLTPAGGRVVAQRLLHHLRPLLEARLAERGLRRRDGRAPVRS